MMEAHSKFEILSFRLGKFAKAYHGLHYVNSSYRLSGSLSSGCDTSCTILCEQ